MATFHVYVEGPVDRSPEGIRKLAHAISQRYGLPSADLITRLEAGRFRVKANVDRATGEAYVRALQEIGAKVALESATSSAPRPATPSAPPANQRSATLPPANQRSGSTSLPPANQRSGSTSLPPATARPSQQNFESGLSAAFTTKERAQSESEFGALGASSFSLASLDGNDEGMATEAGFAPPPAPEPVAPPPPVVAAKKPSGASAPIDLFRPPDAEEAEQEIGLHAEVVAERASRPSLPPVTAPVETPVLGLPNTPAHRRNAPVALEPAPVLRSEPAVPQGRFVVGVVLSILLGFVPAHLIASAREKSAFAAIDNQIVITQNAVDNQDSYNALDGYRANQLARKHSERRSIAIMALVIWAAVGGGLAFVYFKKLPWDKLGKSSP